MHVCTSCSRSGEGVKLIFSVCLCKLFSLIVHLCPQVPPLRVFLFGPRGSGKTVVGHKLASKMGMFHVAFRDYLQEQILPKMKKPPLVDEEDWEGEEKEQGQWHGLALCMIVIVLVCLCIVEGMLLGT